MLTRLIEETLACYFNCTALRIYCNPTKSLAEGNGIGVQCWGKKISCSNFTQIIQTAFILIKHTTCKINSKKVFWYFGGNYIHAHKHTQKPIPVNRIFKTCCELEQRIITGRSGKKDARASIFIIVLCTDWFTLNLLSPSIATEWSHLATLFKWDCWTIILHNQL